MSATEPAIHLRDPMVHDLHMRVTRIEQDSQEGRTELAVMKNDLAYVKDNVGSIRSGINRILFAIGLSVIGAFTTFALSGGLALN